MTKPHIPVLAGEVIDLAGPNPGESVVDATFGGGGHSRLLAERIGAAGALICVDRDPSAESTFREFALEADCSTRFIQSDFVTALEELTQEQISADVVLLDLGISSMQIDTFERGFSYVYDAPLDMRMNPEQELTAHELVNLWEEQRLAAAFRDFGEERYARQIARAIVRERRQSPIETTHQLVEVITAAIPTPARFAGGHPAKRVFQALRIVVNDELGQLERALPLAWDLLAVGGRMAVISFHSLEDKRVKRFFADLESPCTCPPDLPICVCGLVPTAELLNRRAVMPTEGEIATNPRSRSGRLRVACKLNQRGAGGK